MIYEIATAPRSAREYNRRNQPTVALTPPDAGGLALTGTF
jgi:hypothetical protein